MPVGSGIYKKVKSSFVFEKMEGINQETLDSDAADYALKMTFGTWRFIGPIENKDKGALNVLEAFLTNSPETKQLLRKKYSRP